MNHPTLVRQRRHRGIYLLPNILTTAALFSGFYAILAATNGRFSEAAMVIFIAILLDSMDGRVARVTGTQTEFGVQYDSMSDLISSVLAPALVMYHWSLVALHTWGPLWGRIGWLAAFIYVACGALRLARFNVQVSTIDKRYFQGLPSPSAAAVCMSFVWSMSKLGISGSDLCYVVLPGAVITGLLMVSRFRYYSFKSLPVSGRVPFAWIVMAVLLMAFLLLDPPRVLLVGSLIYLVSGPVLTLWGIMSARRRQQRGR